MATTTKPAATIEQAMAAVHAALPAIGKNSTAPAAMGGFKFRGIDAVLDALNPILGEHGVFYMPHVRERIDTAEFRTGGDKPKVIRTVRLRVQYSFHHTGGTDILTTEVWGEADDTSDKATNKALTGAQKAMLFQVFAINTEDQAADDPDRGLAAQGNSTNQPTVHRREPEPSQSEPIHPDEQPVLKEGWATLNQQERSHEELYGAIRQAKPEVQEAMRAWRKEHNLPTVMDRIWYDACAAKYLEVEAEHPDTQEVPT